MLVGQRAADDNEVGHLPRSPPIMERRPASPATVYAALTAVICLALGGAAGWTIGRSAASRTSVSAASSSPATLSPSPPTTKPATPRPASLRRLDKPLVDHA